MIVSRGYGRSSHGSMVAYGMTREQAIQTIARFLSVVLEVRN